MALDPREMRAAIAHLKKTGEYDELRATSEEELDRLASPLVDVVELTDAEVDAIWETLPHSVAEAGAADAQARRVVEHLAHRGGAAADEGEEGGRD
jgi:hypothetical protein